MKTYPRILIAFGFTIALLAAIGIGMHLSARAAATSENWSLEDITAGQANYPAGLTSDANPVEENLYQGQGSTRNDDNVDSTNSIPASQISYQGRLLHNGSPYNGSIPLTFRLYSLESGGLAWWTETLTVTVNQGLFNAMLGSVTPNPIVNLDIQTWLGIQPAGAASELAPRQLLSASPYAMSLIPGATMYDSSTGAYNSSLWVNSDNHVAMHTESGNQNAFESVAHAVGMSGVSATGSGNNGHGVKAVYSGAATTCSGVATDCAAAIYGISTGDSYGIFTHTSGRSGIFIRSDTTGYYDLFDSNTGNSTRGGMYTTGPLVVAGYATFNGGKSGFVVDIAKNGGSQPLERGDVVIIIGNEAAVVGDIPVAVVDKANTMNATSIMGVVDVLFTPCDKPQDSLQSGEKCGGFDPSVTIIQPGQYLSVVTLGAYGYIKVDATKDPIQPGDLLVSTDSGVAAKAVQITVNGVSFYAPGTIIGKALGSLNSGVGFIPVFISTH